MRFILPAALTALFAATTAQAGSLSSTGDPVVTKPGSSMVVKHPDCSGVLVGGCGYCIGGKVYHL